MKTHELATALALFAKALRASPNQELDSFFKAASHTKKPHATDIPIALSTLVALSDIDKNQWAHFITSHGYPIPIRPRDASRDILGKLFTYLEQNPEARKRLTSAVQKGRSETSPELQKALAFLLKP